MNGNHRTVLLAGLVCTVAAWAPRPAHTARAADPCALLTPTQISAVVKATVGKGDPIGTTGCQWMSPPVGDNGSVRATLVLYDGGDFATMKTPLPGVTRTPAPGVGDDAFYSTVGTLTTLTVKRGATAFVVRLYGVDGQQQQMTMEKALALQGTMRAAYVLYQWSR